MFTQYEIMDYSYKWLKRERELGTRSPYPNESHAELYFIWGKFWQKHLQLINELYMWANIELTLENHGTEYS